MRSWGSSGAARSHSTSPPSSGRRQRRAGAGAAAPPPSTAGAPSATALTRLGTALFAPPPGPWELRPEGLDPAGSEQLPYHLAARGAQVRIVASPMKSFRTTIAKSGQRDWKSGQIESGVVDGLDLHGMDASVSALWVRASVVRNDADGRSYIFILVAPQKFQKDVLAEYQQILTSWKWTQR